MKNIIYNISRALSLALPLFATLSVRAEQIDTLLHFNYADLRVDTVTAPDGNTYTKLAYPGCVEGEKEGTPSLPIKYLPITVPYTAENISIRIQDTHTTSHFLSHRILPIQRPVPTLLGKYDNSFIPCDSAFYVFSSAYPSRCASITSVSCAGTDSQVVILAVCPVSYFPADNKYHFNEEIALSISYSNSANRQRHWDEIRNKSLSFDIGIPYYEYFVITKRALKDAFTRLIAWRRQKGLDAGVVCVEDILSNQYIVGDTVSNIMDDAGKIRQYLQYAYRYGNARYVLFGGNDSIVPIRYGTGGDDYWTKPQQFPILNDYKIPSDLYFSELNSNWNKDGDQYLGELSDQLDYGSELAVGRILCSSSEEVENYTDKLLRYELYPGNGDFSYLKKAFFQQADDSQSFGNGGQANVVATALGGNFTTKKIIQEEPTANSTNTTSPYGKDIIDSLKMHYGYVSWFGHGHPNGITTKSNTIFIEGEGFNTLYQPYGITSVEDNVPYLMPEDGNSLDNLENKSHPMIAYSVACTITPFDVFNEYSEFPNIGQSFTLGKNYGGPALIGNTRYGWVYSSYLLQKKFHEFMINDPIGDAQNKAKLSFPSHYLKHSSNVIGCPFIRIWTDLPSLFNATISYSSDNYIISANSSITDAEIDVRDITHTKETMSVVNFDPSQGPKILTNVENNLLTLTGKNCLPQIMPLTLQNDTLQGTHHLIVKDVICGKDVRNDTQGNVIFEEGSDYTFETKGTFRLTKGVAIRQGVKLKVTPSEINY